MSYRQMILVAAAIASLPFRAFAQLTVDSNLTTPSGHELNFNVGGYDYVEPGDTSISIHGLKFGGGYTGTMLLNANRHWFLQADAQGLAGRTTYDGWCYPFLIRPDSRSINGYALTVGDSSPCSESGDNDWYIEGHVLIGKDFIGRRWGWSPTGGLGVRHLSNGIAGIPGFRTDEYLYVPIGITARTMVASRSAVSFNVEYDRLVRGWQQTRNSQLGGGEVPATPSAPPFTIEGFSDISFDQHSGWALRASAKYHVARRWSIEPEYIHWNVSDSPVSYETATFTVNRITAQQQLGAYEPLNTTNEFTVKLGFHF